MAPHGPPRPPRAVARTLEDLRPHVREGRYRLGPHAVRHAAAEGFVERDVVMTLLHGRELARYVHDRRLLVLGWVPAGPEVRVPLHVVVAYGRPRWVDVVTAFVPRDPHRVVSRSRLAELLRHDRDGVVVRHAGPAPEPERG
jgi:hypothetical protein